MSIQQVQALEDRIRLALRERRDSEVTRLWEEIHRLSPSHVAALTALGQRAVQRGDFRAARSYFEALLGADPQNPEHCGNLALICRELSDDDAEEAAIKRALTIDPLDLLGLILRAERFERSGDRHAAASAYGAVANVAPNPTIIAPHLRGAVEKAFAYRSGYDQEFGAFLDERLTAAQGSGSGVGATRFRDSVDMLVGRKRRYESRSAAFHYAGLPLVEFVDRADLPFLDAFEDQTTAIRDEFLAVLRADAGFEPYINYDADQPVNQWAELNHNPQWSAFHLLKDGAPVAENAVK